MDASTIPDTSQTGSDTGVGDLTGTESSLSNWAGDYVTDMLGKGQALSNTDYEAYTGPLTAGSSGLQDTAFQGLAGLAMPTDAQMQPFDPASFTDAGVAEQYMNPYLMQSLQPQIDEANRQATLQRLQDAGRLVQAGAFGGSRQAVMESEGNRNANQNIAAITGAGYNQAYTTAQQQFNAEQNMGLGATSAAQQYGLNSIAAQAEVGAQERGITAEGIAADKAQFEEERLFPYKQAQYQQSLLQGLPVAAQNYSYSTPSELSTMLTATGGLEAIYNTLFGGGAGTPPPAGEVNPEPTV